MIGCLHTLSTQLSLFVDAIPMVDSDAVAEAVRKEIERQMVSTARNRIRPRTLAPDGRRITGATSPSPHPSRLGP